MIKYIALCALLLLVLSACPALMQRPQVIADATEAELIERGFSPEEAAAVADVVEEQAEATEPAIPEWVSLTLMGVLTALGIPTAGILLKNRRAGKAPPTA